LPAGAVMTSPTAMDVPLGTVNVVPDVEPVKLVTWLTGSVYVAAVEPVYVKVEKSSVPLPDAEPA
jgi:hypothetical protein